MLLPLAAGAGSLRRCRADERGRVECQPTEALRFFSWSAYEKSIAPIEHGVGPRKWRCHRLPSGVVVCERLDRPVPGRGALRLHERKAFELPSLVSAPETFR